MLWSRIFVLFSESKLTLILSLIAVLQPTEAQISRNRRISIFHNNLATTRMFTKDRCQSVFTSTRFQYRFYLMGNFFQPIRSRLNGNCFIYTLHI